MLGMEVGWRSDINRVHVARQDLMQILELAGAGELPGRGLELIVINITNRRDARELVFGENSADGSAPAAAANEANRQRGVGLRAAHELRRNDSESGGSGGGPLQKGAPAGGVVHKFFPIWIAESISITVWAVFNPGPAR